MQPLYDALNDFFPARQVQKMLEEKQIEIAPLAFMRGRTLSNAYVVLDEAQNATTMQMKMFLTRLGEGSRMAVTGDTTQIDLPRGVLSGLVEAERVLRGVDGIGFARFTAADVVRHSLVALRRRCPEVSISLAMICRTIRPEKPYPLGLLTNHRCRSSTSSAPATSSGGRSTAWASVPGVTRSSSMAAASTWRWSRVGEPAGPVCRGERRPRPSRDRAARPGARATIRDRGIQRRPPRRCAAVRPAPGPPAAASH
jgi:hypothetical protein